MNDPLVRLFECPNSWLIDDMCAAGTVLVKNDPAAFVSFAYFTVDFRQTNSSVS